MRYRITGADSRTGKEMTLTIMAAGDKEAEKIARQSGLMVSSIEADLPAPADAQAEPAADEDPPAHEQIPARSPLAPAPPSERPAVPEYRDIARGARALAGFATFATVLGWICIVLGLVVAVVMMVAGLAAGSAAASAGGGGSAAMGGAAGGAMMGLAIGTVPALYGTALLIAGALLRMQASLAVAVRDIARNSFH